MQGYIPAITKKIVARLKTPTDIQSECIFRVPLFIHKP